jgi:hypothetical protein
VALEVALCRCKGEGIHLKACTGEEQEQSHILEFFKMSKTKEESADLWMVTLPYIV